MRLVSVAAAVLLGAGASEPLGVTGQARVPALPEFEPVRGFVQKSVADGLTPSVALGLIKNGVLVWSEGFGLADRERQTPATPDTIYWLASVSKPLSATGLMQLVERGLVDLDQPANKYMGDAKLRAYVGSVDDMTVRRLANHTAGLPVHANFFYGLTPPSMDETIRRYGFASLEPGKQSQYSNLAFGILGYIVERTAKRPWRAYQEAQVYAPLKMSRTSDRIRPGFERDEAAPYSTDVAGRFIRWARYDFDHRPASSNFSTVNDLSRFLRMHLNGGELDGARVLQPESVKEMQRFASDSRPGRGFGLGWERVDFGAHQGISHAGGMPAVAALITAFPADRAATIVLSNGDNRQLVQQITRKLGQLLFPEVKDPQAPPPMTSPTPVAPSQALVGSWTGRLLHYDGDVPLRMTVKGDGGIDVSFGSKPPLALRDTTLNDTNMLGRVDASLRAQDGYRGLSELRFMLSLRDGRLSGVCSAYVSNYFTLPYWVDLERIP